MFEDLKRTGALLRPADSAAKLVALLRKRNFKSGDHVDFYDEKVKEACGGAGAVASGSGAGGTGGGAGSSGGGGIVGGGTNTTTAAAGVPTAFQPA